MGKRVMNSWIVLGKQIRTFQNKDKDGDPDASNAKKSGKVVKDGEPLTIKK